MRNAEFVHSNPDIESGTSAYKPSGKPADGETKREAKKKGCFGLGFGCGGIVGVTLLLLIIGVVFIAVRSSEDDETTDEPAEVVARARVASLLSENCNNASLSQSEAESAGLSHSVSVSMDIYFENVTAPGCSDVSGLVGPLASLAQVPANRVLVSTTPAAPGTGGGAASLATVDVAFLAISVETGRELISTISTALQATPTDDDSPDGGAAQGLATWIEQQLPAATVTAAPATGRTFVVADIDYSSATPAPGQPSPSPSPAAGGGGASPTPSASPAAQLHPDQVDTVNIPDPISVFNILGAHGSGEVLLWAGDTAHGRELFKVGQTGGVELIEDTNAGTGMTYYESPRRGYGPMQVASKTCVSPIGLVVCYDGTTLESIASGISSDYDEWITDGTTVYYVSTRNHPTHGPQQMIFIYDGTSSPTEMPMPTEALQAAMYPGVPALHDGKVYFKTHTADFGVELTVYDGTSSTLLDLRSGARQGLYPKNMISFGGKLYFMGEESSAVGYELMTYTDGATTAERVSATEMVAGADDPNAASFTVLDATRMIFVATTPAEGTELWSVTTAGSLGIVLDINPGTDSSQISSFSILNNVAYFAANDGTHGHELWSYDGSTTPAMLHEFNPGAANGLNPSSLFYNTGSRLFMQADSSEGWNPWHYNGQGTPERLIDLPRNTTTLRLQMLAQGTKLFVRASEGQETALYRIDQP